MVMLSSNVLIEELVMSSLRALPFTKPFFTPGGWSASVSYTHLTLPTKLEV